MVLIDSGTVTADGTEQVLSTKTPLIATLYILKVSCVAILSGDVVELRLYTKMLSSGNSYECLFYDSFNFNDITNDIQKQSVGAAVGPNMSIQATLKQTAGTNRAYKWELFSL